MEDGTTIETADSRFRRGAAAMPNIQILAHQGKREVVKEEKITSRLSGKAGYG